MSYFGQGTYNTARIEWVSQISTYLFLNSYQSNTFSCIEKRIESLHKSARFSNCNSISDDPIMTSRRKHDVSQNATRSLMRALSEKLEKPIYPRAHYCWWCDALFECVSFRKSGYHPRPTPNLFPTVKQTPSFPPNVLFIYWAWKGLLLSIKGIKTKDLYFSSWVCMGKVRLHLTS